MYLSSGLGLQAGALNHWVHNRETIENHGSNPKLPRSKSYSRSPKSTELRGGDGTAPSIANDAKAFVLSTRRKGCLQVHAKDLLEPLRTILPIRVRVRTILQ